MNVKELVVAGVRKMPYGFLYLNFVVCLICGLCLVSGVTTAIGMEAYSMVLGIAFLLAASGWVAYIVIKKKN